MAAYLPILIFIALALVVAGVMLAIPQVVAPLRKGREKLEPYECGFEAFDTARRPFDVQFFLVAILFIVFDLEVAFLFPWAMVLKTLSWEGFGSVMVFLGVLTVGFIYEWKKGALEWQ